MKKIKATKIVILLVIIFSSAYYITKNIDLNHSGVSLPIVDTSRSFTVVVLPDTQNYSANNPEIFCQQTQWIVDHKDDLNIVFVSHVGDIVNDGATKMYEWDNALRCMSKLDGVVPYSVIPGNHDADIASNKTSGFSAYNRHFPASKFVDKQWYGGNYKNNQNNFQKMKVNGLNLLFLNLEIEPTDEVLFWADSVIKDNLSSYTILTTHKYLPIDSSARDRDVVFGKDGNSGEDIWTKLIYKNCSIAQVWSGHFHGENRVTSKNLCDDNVYEIVQDYQDRSNGGDGWLRLFVFTPISNTVNVYTYSPFLGLLETDRDSQFKFRFKSRNI